MSISSKSLRRYASNLGLPSFSLGETVMEPLFQGSAYTQLMTWDGDTLRWALRSGLISGNTSQPRTSLFAVRGVKGRTITFDCRQWAATRWLAAPTYAAPCYSEDGGVTWVVFSDIVEQSSTRIAVRATFSRNIVLISLNPHSSYTRWMDFAKTKIFTHPLVSVIPSSHSGFEVVAPQPGVSAISEAVGVARPAQPILGFRMRSSTATNLVVLVDGVHCDGEQGSKNPLRGFINFVLFSNDADAVYFREHFALHCYLNINPVGQIAGGQRWAMHSNGSTFLDMNRAWNETSNVPHHEVLKTHMLAARTAEGLGTAKLVMNFHQFTSGGNPGYLYFKDSAGTPNRKFFDRYVIHQTGFLKNDPQSYSAGLGADVNFWDEVNGYVCAINHETRLNTPVLTGEEMGVDLVKVLNEMHVANEF